MVFYDGHMRHIEMHHVENPHDERLAAVAGLDVYDDDVCVECGKSIGSSALSSAEHFVPYVILLDDESEWLVCAECASPVL